MHHGLVADGDDLDDVGVLPCQRDRTVDFGPVAFQVLFGVVGCIRPGALAVNPCAEHNVHLESWLFLLQFVDGLHDVAGVRKLDVVGAQEPDAHGVEQPHVLLQLREGGLLGPAASPVSAVGDGGVVGISQEFGCRFVVHGVMLV